MMQQDVLDCDNWDDHWKRFEEAAKNNPALQWRHRHVAQLLKSLVQASGSPSSNILDIGSGNGDMLARIVEDLPAQLNFLGLELSSSGVNYARNKVPTATFYQVDLLKKQEAPEHIRHWGHFIICSEVLEHVDDPIALLKGAKEFMAPNAQIIVTVPGGPMSAFDHVIGHRQHYTRESLRILLENAGFAKIDTWAAGWPAINLYRYAVILRGKKLAEEASGHPSLMVRFANHLFRVLFTIAAPIRSKYGWQIIGTARNQV